MPSPQSEIVEHGDDPLPLPAEEQCDVAKEEIGRGQIKKTPKQLLLLPFQRKSGKDKSRKSKKKQQREGVPSPFARSHSLDASANLCCLAIGSKHRTCSDRRPSSYHLFVKSLIEKNPFYAKDCDVHSR